MMARLLACAVLAALGVSSAEAAAKAPRVPVGPKGDRFYAGPKHLAKGAHGSLVWARPLTGNPGLKGAASNTLVLYRSVSPAGKADIVSGIVAVPKGKPPTGGWPLVSFAHGTTGANDADAGSKNASLPGGLENDMLRAWLQDGYAVAQTDYQGLGTPGDHPYLIGTAEARAVTDMVRAARHLNSGIGRRWVALGHDAGAHAVLFTAAQGAKWAPETKLLGAIALAPISHTAELVTASMSETTPNEILGYLPLLLRGAQTEGVDPAPLLTPRAAQLLALTAKPLEGSIGQLSGPDEWGGLPRNEVFKQGADVNPLLSVLRRNDPGALKLSVPVFVAYPNAYEPGKTVNDDLVKQLQTGGATVDYRTYDTHFSGPETFPLTFPIMTAALPDSLAWAKERFG